MISADRAWQAICRATLPLPAQKVALDAALGAYLAEPIRADRDIPPADRAAMDGFAVRAADVGTVPAHLCVIGEIAAGAAIEQAIGPGECLRIFTGANMPPGADTVVRVEDTSLGRFAGSEPQVEAVIAVPVRRGSNIFRQGENARAGQELLPAGTRLGPNQLAVAAACGYGSVAMHARPGVAILTTGTELLAADADAPGAHEIRDSNGIMLASACRAEGFPVVLIRSVPDDLEATRKAIAEAGSRADVVVLTGGVSAGAYDFVRPALDALGAVVHYHGVAMKPGKPQLFATLPGGTAVFGLPGNPLSAVIGLHEFVLPGIRLRAGCPAAGCRPLLHLPLAAPAGKAEEPNDDRLQVIPAVIETGPNGAQVRPRPPVGSADLVTAGVADGAILVPPGAGPMPAGRVVAFRPWGGLGR